MAKNVFYPKNIDQACVSVVVSNDSGDYVGNTETAINDAINAIPNSGGTLVIKAGTYIINNPINLKSHLKIIGEGYSTILKLGSGVNNNVMVGSLVDFSDISFLKIDGNSIENNSGNGLNLTKVRWSRFDNLWIGSCAGNGIQCAPTAPNVFEDNIFSRCEVVGNGSYGIKINALDSHVSMCYIHNNTLDGIYIGSAVGGWIIDSNHLWLNNTGIRLNGSGGDINNIIITNNYIELNQYEGIYANDEIKDNVIANNIIWHNSYSSADIYAGIKISNPYGGWAANNVIIGNKIWNNHGSSIIIETDSSAPANTVTGNDLEENLSIRSKDVEVGNSGQATNLRVQPYKSNSTSDPSSAPTAIGDIFVNTITGSCFISTGTSGSANWKVLN